WVSELEMRHDLAVAENRRAGAGAERQDHFYSAALDCAKALHVGIVEHAHGLPPMLGKCGLQVEPRQHLATRLGAVNTQPGKPTDTRSKSPRRRQRPRRWKSARR